MQCEPCNTESQCSRWCSCPAVVRLHSGPAGWFGFLDILACGGFCGGRPQSDTPAPSLEGPPRSPECVWNTSSAVARYAAVTSGSAGLCCCQVSPRPLRCQRDRCGRTPTAPPKPHETRVGQVPRGVERGAAWGYRYGQPWHGCRACRCEQGSVGDVWRVPEAWAMHMVDIA